MPSRFLLVAIFAFLVAAATGIQRLLGLVRERRVLSAALRGAVALTAILVFVDLRSQSEAWQEDSAQGQPVALDHRPPILLIPAAPGSRVRFSRFTPNRFAVAVRSAETAHLVLAGERWIRKDNWRIEGGTVESVGGRVGVRVSPGEHEVLFRYKLRFFPLGLTLSALTLLTGLLQAFGLRVRRRRSPAGRSR